MNFNIYKNIKNNGYNPKIIFDIGAFKGEWSLGIKNIFTNSKIIAIDANSYDILIPNSDVSLYETLSDIDGKEVLFYKTKHKFSIGTGDSIYRENTKYYSDEFIIKEVRKTKTLYTLFKEIGIEKCDILKIDTQGSELDILIGLQNKIKDIDYIQLECSLIEYNFGGCNLNEIFYYMYQNSFEIFSTFEEHKNEKNEIFQIDFIFKNKNI